MAINGLAVGMGIGAVIGAGATTHWLMTSSIEHSKPKTSNGKQHNVMNSDKLLGYSLLTMLGGAVASGVALGVLLCLPRGTARTAMSPVAGAAVGATVGAVGTFGLDLFATPI